MCCHIFFLQGNRAAMTYSARNATEMMIGPKWRSACARFGFERLRLAQCLRF
jgi:hypothetical protein